MIDKNGKDYPEVFWINIAQQLAAKGMKTKTLADMVGVQAQFLSTAKYKKCDIRVSLIYHIAKALNTTVGNLISEDIRNYETEKKPALAGDNDEDYKRFVKDLFKNTVTYALPKLTLEECKEITTKVFECLGRDFHKVSSELEEK